MSKKQIFKNGQWVDLPADSELAKKMDAFDSTFIIKFGMVLQYKDGANINVGKVTGADKEGNITLAKVCNASKSGYQFSSTDTVKIRKEQIIKQIN